jgi:hypothetical protein
MPDKSTVEDSIADSEGSCGILDIMVKENPFNILKENEETSPAA